MFSLLTGNTKLFRILRFSSNPKTDVRMIFAEFYGKKKQQQNYSDQGLDLAYS